MANITTTAATAILSYNNKATDIHLFAFLKTQPFRGCFYLLRSQKRNYASTVARALNFATANTYMKSRFSPGTNKSSYTKLGNKIKTNNFFLGRIKPMR